MQKRSRLAIVRNCALPIALSRCAATAANGFVQFTVLGEYVNHRVAEEEKQILPQAKKARVDMQALGKEIKQRKRELQQQAGVASDE